MLKNLRIHIKDENEIAIMRVAGRIVAEVLSELREHCREGVSTADLNRIAHELTLKKGATPSFKGYRGFPESLCTSINDEVVHGIPSPKRVLKSGDVIGIDFGAIYNGYHGDAATTVPIGQIKDETADLLRVTEKCLYDGIAMAIPGNYISDISAAIQATAQAHGYGIVRDFCGHGIGRKLHEDPPVLNYVNGKGARIKAGMALAIEPMINMGTEKVVVLRDGWTVVTHDGKPSAHFEHTIIVMPEGPEILTRV